MAKKGWEAILHERLVDDQELRQRVMLLCEPPVLARLETSRDAYLIFAPLLFGLDHEALAIIALDRRNQVLGSKVLNRGCDNFTIVEPKQIFRFALLQGKNGAAGIVLAHNHPSGDPTPSKQDQEVTERIKQSGLVLGIELIDHLVVTDHNNYCSMLEMGLMTRTSGVLLYANIAR